ncbi:uncharacterized protein [Typha latifolia]|uniref:uncharacterized protein n=1 Tax=Typha latifolia TaxID=4733 RepID=UPI003C2B63BC
MRARLYVMRVDPDENCAMCGIHRESIAHLFFTCRVAKEIWRALATSQGWGDEWPSMMIEDWITTSWNADSEETLDCKSARAVQLAKDYAKQGRPRSTLERPQVARWTYPAKGWIKVNVDGAFSGVDRLGGAGAVIRAADGTLVAAAWEPSADESSLRTEGHALRLGLRLAAGYAKVEVESDSLELVRIMQKRVNCP